MQDGFDRFAKVCTTLFIAMVLQGRLSAQAVSVDAAKTLTIPAYTAYTLPNPHAARIQESVGITRWKDAQQRVVWYGQFEKTGLLHARVRLAVTPELPPELNVTIAGVKHAGKPGPIVQGETTYDFGEWSLPESGYIPISLELGKENEPPAFRVTELQLEGPATEGAHFNLKERRNAASVHLMYPIEAGVQVEAFYNEVTAVEDPTGTFYMACGWHRGYFGMQVNSPTERRIIFSVWDSGEEAVDRTKVAAENRVRLIDKGRDVFTGDFGNEGTGGHSHLKFLWETGSVQKFLVTATPTDATHTTFAGYWFHPTDQRWMLISAWNAPKEGGRLRGLHSFSENFIGESGHLHRKALYGNGWYRTDDGNWHAITTARFSHDPTGKEDRLDRSMGIENNQFFLSHGGFVPGFTKYGERFSREPAGQPPSNIEWPPPSKDRP